LPPRVALWQNRGNFFFPGRGYQQEGIHPSKVSPFKLNKENCMKKSLIALAVAGAFATPAMAVEFTPSLYVSMGAGFGQEKVADVKTAGNQVFSGGGNILGFKISDDIGDGMKAFASVGLTIHPNNSGGINNRYGKVGLESGSFGTVWIGSGEQVYELGQIIDGWGADYLGGASVNGGHGPTAIGGAGTGAGFNFTRLDDSVVAWTSPNFSNFTIDAVYVMGPSATTGAPAEKDGNGYQAAIKWDGGKDMPLMIQAALASYKDYAGGVSFAGATSGTVKADAMRLTATWDFGVVKIGGTIQQLKSEDQAVAGTEDKVTAYSLTGTLPVATGRIIANYTASGKQKVNGNEVADSDATGYDIGYQHDFSKTSYGYIRYEANKEGTNYSTIGGGEFKHDYVMIGMKVSY
jgi:predicted porin